jgi:type IV pilus assembly protein PilB
MPPNTLATGPGPGLQRRAPEQDVEPDGAARPRDRQHLGAGIRERLGEILLRKGRLDRDQLAQAIVQAREHGMHVGEWLVDSRLIAEEDLARALADQFGLRYVTVELANLQPAFAGVLSEMTARRLDALPLSSSQEGAIVAISDPTDIMLRDELEVRLPELGEVVVAAPSMIRKGIDLLYAPQATVVEGGEQAHTGDVRRQAAIDAEADADSAPAVEAVNRLLRRGIELGASDIHFVPQRNDLLVRARVDGVMRDIESIPLAQRASVVARLKVMGQLDIAERRLPQDGRAAVSLGGTDMDLRVAVLPSARGEEVVLRIAYIGRQGLRSLDDLGLDPQTRSILQRSLHKPGGAIIVAGPTGSGKTTTLYAALAELNDGSRTIVSIEDPVESVIDGIVQIEVNTRAGLTFGRGLRTILRADPDVILVGEIRDLETAEIALNAAMTGHVVLSTIHADNAVAGLVRLASLGISEAALATAVHSLLSQRLLRRPCERCAQGTRLDPHELARAGLPETSEHYRPQGCSACDHTGYVGRVAVYEAVQMDDRMRNVLGAAAAMPQAALDSGSVPLYENARKLCDAGITTVDEVIRVLGEYE